MGCEVRERFQISGEGIMITSILQLFEGLVNQVSVMRVQNFLDGAWGHLIGRGRPDVGGGHRVVRLRRLIGSIIGHARSFD